MLFTVFNSSSFPIVNKFCYSKNVLTYFHQTTNMKWAGKQCTTCPVCITIDSYWLWLWHQLRLMCPQWIAYRFFVHLMLSSWRKCVNVFATTKFMHHRKLWWVEDCDELLNMRLIAAEYNMEIVKLLNNYDKCLNARGYYVKK